MAAALAALAAPGVSIAQAASSPAPVARDAKGNVGYATAADCDAAVANGSAVLYKPYTRSAPRLRAGEARWSTMRLA
ncbi:MAG: hypothetical protein ACOVOG_03340, partial [Rubrivivax sp.]